MATRTAYRMLAGTHAQTGTMELLRYRICKELFKNLAFEDIYSGRSAALPSICPPRLLTASQGCTSRLSMVERMLPKVAFALSAVDSDHVDEAAVTRCEDRLRAVDWYTAAQARDHANVLALLREVREATPPVPAIQSHELQSVRRRSRDLVEAAAMSADSSYLSLLPMEFISDEDKEYWRSIDEAHDRAQASRPTSRRPPRGWVETADASTQTLSFVPEPSTAESDRADILRICKLRYVEPISLPHVAASESDECSAGDESDHAAASAPLPAAPACSDSADDDGGAPGPSGRQPWRPEPRDERARLRFELESDSSFA